MSLLAQTQRNPFEDQAPEMVSGVTVDAEKAYLDKIRAAQNRRRIGKVILKAAATIGAIMAAGYAGRTLANSEAVASLGDKLSAEEEIQDARPLSFESARKGLDLIQCTEKLTKIGINTQEATSRCLSSLRSTVIIHEEE